MEPNPHPKSLAGAQPVTIKKLIQYQPESVVSRELLKKPTGTVTIFAFDAGQGLSEHTAPFDALAQVIEGEAEITIAGQPHLVTAGQLILMPAGQPHAVKANTSFQMILTMIRNATPPKP